jgi:hypothetical protein
MRPVTYCLQLPLVPRRAWKMHVDMFRKVKTALPGRHRGREMSSPFPIAVPLTMISGDTEASECVL